mmetsp:Transcript_49524/g.105923  ORF Transcript_49524/g.105923 Transcript_49524/m.105923 type:complete len:431 (+) Transcript_49524:57-1349(+)
MIVYKKGYWGFFILLHFAGTSWPAGIVPGLFSAIMGFVLSKVAAIDETVSDKERFLNNPYPFQLFAYLVGFVMVFRTNFAYQRYWLALDAVQRMGAKWFDGACMGVTFDALGDVTRPFLKGRDDPEKTDDSLAGVSHTEFSYELIHLFSLLHALALQHLRSDTDLKNLSGVKKSVRISELTMLGCEGALTTVGSRGDSFVATFSESSVRRKLEMRKLQVLGKLVPEELSLLEQDNSGKLLPTVARVAMVQSWIVRRLIARQKHEPRGDSSKTSPPILSRLYQVISDGHLAFSQAAEVVEVPFPFPYHNLIRIFLWLYTLTVPFLINAKVLNAVARFVMNFCAVWAYFALCEVGDNLEDPFFPYDPNELPLEAIQHTFNARLLSTQIVPAQSPRSPEEQLVVAPLGLEVTTASAAPSTASTRVSKGGGGGL